MRPVALPWVAIVAALVVSAGCKSTPKGCDEKGLDQVIKAVDQVGSDDRGILVAVGISEACTSTEKPMPAALKKALSSFGQVSPEQRPLVALKALADDPILWSLACRGGIGTAQALAAAPDAERGKILADQCPTADSYVTADALRSAPMSLGILGLMTEVWLRTEGTDSARAKKLTRVMLP